jgi:hypothetical protein
MTLKVKFLQALRGDSTLITNKSENGVSRILSMVAHLMLLDLASLATHAMGSLKML